MEAFPLIFHLFEHLWIILVSFIFAFYIWITSLLLYEYDTFLSGPSFTEVVWMILIPKATLATLFYLPSEIHSVELWSVGVGVAVGAGGVCVGCTCACTHLPILEAGCNLV